MVVTLLVVLDRFQDHRENKQTEQRGDDDGINHGASSKGCFRSSPAPAQSLCQSRDLHKGCFVVLSSPLFGGRKWSGNPSVGGGCIPWVAIDHLETKSNQRCLLSWRRSWLVFMPMPFGSCISMTHECSSFVRWDDAFDEAK